MNAIKIMKKVIFISFFLLIKVSFSQKNKIYLSFDLSNQDEISVSTRKINDSITFKTFLLRKKIPKEEYKYDLFYDRDVIKKGIKGNIHHNTLGIITMFHYSLIHKKCQLNNLLLQKSNIINYEIFINSRFDSFIKVIEKSDKIFIINKQKNECYEVSIAN